jgi:hypothetical protein
MSVRSLQHPNVAAICAENATASQSADLQENVHKSQG